MGAIIRGVRPTCSSCLMQSQYIYLKSSKLDGSTITANDKTLKLRLSRQMNNHIGDNSQVLLKHL